MNFCKTQMWGQGIAAHNYKMSVCFRDGIKSIFTQDNGI